MLKEAIKEDNSLIIQEYMNCIDMDADVYIDIITHEAVSAFLKKKIETRMRVQVRQFLLKITGSLNLHRKFVLY